jgi:predicted AlkP superfamily phosphohydrolase/phosphomutase
MDPDLVERWMKEGKLPTFATLAADGGLHRLQTTHGAQSATAWASFATGVNPGKHSVFDLLVRDAKTYVPRLAIARPSATHGGTPFWVTAGEAGVRSSILPVPLTFPLDDVPNGEWHEAAFMEEIDRTFTERAETILKLAAATDWDLLVGVVDTTDRVQHMMWRLIDPVHPMYDAELARLHGTAIEQTYRRADTFVSELLRHLEADTTVLIVSDHGFHPFRWSVNLNSWLVERGYMTLQGPMPRRKTFDDLVGGRFWENIDWTKTRAYAMGLGQVFVNLKGREGQGIVSEGEEYDQLLDSLIIDLMNFLDPRTQNRVVASVHKRAEIYNGPYADDAADLLIGLESGYRISWQTVLGGTPSEVIEPNMTKWSGDHGSLDFRNTEGVLITNRRLPAQAMHIVDIAPSVLKHFALAIPPNLDGKSLF